jgi:hypothetical protein
MSEKAIADELLALAEGDRVDLTVVDYAEPATFVMDSRDRIPLTKRGSDVEVGTRYTLHFRPTGEGPHHDADGHRLLVNEYDTDRPADLSTLRAEVYDEETRDYTIEDRGAVTNVSAVE